MHDEHKEPLLLNCSGNESYTTLQVNIRCIFTVSKTDSLALDKREDYGMCDDKKGYPKSSLGVHVCIITAQRRERGKTEER